MRNNECGQVYCNLYIATHRLVQVSDLVGPSSGSTQLYTTFFHTILCSLIMGQFGPTYVGAAVL